MEEKKKHMRMLRAAMQTQHQHTIAFNISFSLLLLVLAVAVTEPLYRLLPAPQNIIVVYMLAIFLISAITDGYVYGVLSSALGVLLFDFFITDPRFSFSFAAGFPVTLFIMLLVSLATSYILAQIKLKAKIAGEKEMRAELLYDINRELLSARDIPSIAACTNEYLASYFGRSVFFYPHDPTEDDTCYFRQEGSDYSASFFEDAAEREAAHQAFVSGATSGCGTGSAGGTRALYYPIVSPSQRALGVIGVSCKEGPLTPLDIKFLELVSGQTMNALRAQTLVEAQQATQLVAETEKARSSFLQSISHDLRTPLTSILGASGVLLESDDTLDAATRKKLVHDIHADSEWLLRMVENILSVTRIHDSRMKVHKTLEAAEEVVGETVAKIRSRFQEVQVSVSAPDELLMVPMDAILIAQVLTNLVENALAHAGVEQPVVHVDVTREDGFARFCVTDNGKGISDAVLPRLFEMQPKYDALIMDASRGLGMGLSICKTIVQAHGGSIEGHNQPEGGAEFCFTLPLGEQEEGVS